MEGELEAVAKLFVQSEVRVIFRSPGTGVLLFEMQLHLPSRERLDITTPCNPTCSALYTI
jgi:hypothetical protein